MTFVICNLQHNVIHNILKYKDRIIVENEINLLQGVQSEFRHHF